MDHFCGLRAISYVDWEWGGWLLRAIELVERPVQMEFWELGSRRHMLGLEEVELETKPGWRIWFPGLSVRHPYPADWQEGDRKHFLDAAIF